MSNPARRRHYRVPLDPSLGLAVEVLGAGPPGGKFEPRDVTLAGLAILAPPAEMPWLTARETVELRVFLPERAQFLLIPAVVESRVLEPEHGAVEVGAPTGPRTAVARTEHRPARESPAPSARLDRIAFRFLDPEALAAQLDPPAWEHFNRRRHQRGELARERLEVRLLSPQHSLRAVLHDLSLGGLSARWSERRDDPPKLGQRIRVGLRLDSGGGLLTYEGTLVHALQCPGALRLGIAFEVERSPKLALREQTIGRALVRAQLRSAALH